MSLVNRYLTYSGGFISIIYLIYLSCLFHDSSCGKSSSNNTAEDADRDAVAAENAKFVALLFIVQDFIVPCCPKTTKKNNRSLHRLDEIGNIENLTGELGF